MDPAGRGEDGVARAEARHVVSLERLLTDHGLAIPYAPVAPVPAIDDLSVACRFAAESERRQIAMYDAALAEELPEDVRCVFAHVRRISHDHHLVDFEACAADPP